MRPFLLFVLLTLPGVLALPASASSCAPLEHLGEIQSSESGLVASTLAKVIEILLDDSPAKTMLLSMLDVFDRKLPVVSVLNDPLSPPTTAVMGLYVSNETRGSRDGNTAFLSLSTGVPFTLVPLVNLWEETTNAMESVLGYRLQSFVLGRLTTSEYLFTFNAANGELLVRGDLLDALDDPALDLSWVMDMYSNATAHFRGMRAVGECGVVDAVVEQLRMLKHFASGGMALCILCIVVLAIALPLIANFALYEIVVAICVRSGKTSAECAQEAISMLALVNLLLPIMALIIVKFCKVNDSSCKQFAAAAKLMAGL